MATDKKRRNGRRASSILSFPLGWGSEKGIDSVRPLWLLLFLLLPVTVPAAAQSHDDSERGTAGVYFDYTRLQAIL